MVTSDYASWSKRTGLMIIDPEDPATIERVARKLAPYSPAGDSWREWIYEAKGVLKALAMPDMEDWEDRTWPPVELD